MDLAHVIVSMVGNLPAKVVCKTCKSQHNYKGELSAKARKTASAPKTRIPRTTVRASEYWEQRMSATKTGSRKYSVKETFQKAEVIEHPQFGMGIVEEVKLNGKIIVLFRTGDKILVHGMASK